MKLSFARYKWVLLALGLVFGIEVYPARAKITMMFSVTPTTHVRLLTVLSFIRIALRIKVCLETITHVEGFCCL